MLLVLLIVVNYLSCLNPTVPFGSTIDYDTFFEIALYNCFEKGYLVKRYMPRFKVTVTCYKEETIKH